MDDNTLTDADDDESSSGKRLKVSTSTAAPPATEGVAMETTCDDVTVASSTVTNDQPPLVQEVIEPDKVQPVEPEVSIIESSMAVDVESPAASQEDIEMLIDAATDSVDDTNVDVVNKLTNSMDENQSVPDSETLLTDQEKNTVDQVNESQEQGDERETNVRESECQEPVAPEILEINEPPNSSDTGLLVVEQPEAASTDTTVVTGLDGSTPVQATLSDVAATSAANPSEQSSSLSPSVLPASVAPTTHVDNAPEQPSGSKPSVDCSSKVSEDTAVQHFNYHLKWFDWKGEQTPIVTQNENGPCPLLAIANVLILARKIVLPKMQQLVSGKQLMEYIGDCILAEVPRQSGNEELVLNFEQNMQDAIDIMHKLQTGIDVNVKFSGVADFEFTRECIVFDLLKIRLYHGWLVDPQDDMHMKTIGGNSYNQLVEKMLLSKEAEGDEMMEGMVIEEFLNSSASQLTYHGLCELNSTIQEEELCVFFRNNHFSTLYKHKGELFILVTDQGFLTEPAVVWETLVNIEGDGQFVNSNFVSVTLQSDGLRILSPVSTQDAMGRSDPIDRTMSQEDRDYLIALSLQQDPPTPPQQMETAPGPPLVDSDHKLALKLQEEENRLLKQQQQQQMRETKQPKHQRHQQQQQQQQQQLGMSQNPYKQSSSGRNQQQQQLQHQHQHHQPSTPTHRTGMGGAPPRHASISQQQQQQQQPQEKEKNCTIL